MQQKKMSIMCYRSLVLLVFHVLGLSSAGTAKSNETEWPLPPTFFQPCTPKEIKPIYYTRPGNDFVVVTWNEPHATDRNGDLLRIEQVEGEISGSSFLGTIFGRTYMIVYLATDKDGLRDSCSFTFTVIVRSCPNLEYPRNGYLACTNSVMYGSSCMLKCYEGFKPTGNGAITCGSGRRFIWNNLQICKKVHCSSPATPKNGALSCSNDSFQYQTVCEIQCDQGFIAVGPLYIMCMADGKWSPEATRCIKHEPEHTQCEPSVCNGHGCIKSSPSHHSVMCKCSYGWTGMQCQIPPNRCAGSICMNNSTCKSENSNYSCTCRNGFSGALCQCSPVNGNWSDWSDWSKCTKTCGLGVRTRHRSCNNPPPDTHGSICSGAYTEVTDCQEDKCKKCPELNKINTNLTLFECEVENRTKLQTCSVYCKNGTVQPTWFKEFERLKCGPETSYKWVPGNVLAFCLAPVVPDGLLLDTEVLYNSNIPTEEQSNCEDKVMQNIKETICAQSTHCNITLTFLSKLAGADIRTQLILIFEWYLNYISPSTSDDLDKAVVKELASAISDLGSTAEYMKNFTKELFDINSRHGVFQVNESSLRQQTLVICPEGHALLNSICVECPAGTYVQNSKCFFCPRGMFQELPGQAFCVSCPHDHTTASVGSTHVVQCYAYDVVQIDRLSDALEKGGHIAAIIGPLLTVITAIPFFLACRWKYRKMKEEEENIRKMKEKKENIRKMKEKKENIRKMKEEKENIRKMKEEEENISSC